MEEKTKDKSYELLLLDCCYFSNERQKKVNVPTGPTSEEHCFCAERIGLLPAAHDLGGRHAQGGVVLTENVGTLVSSEESFSLRRAIIIGGAFIGLLIGSGFATGQEIIQYFVSWGYIGIFGAVAVLALLVFVGVGFISVGHAEKFEKGTEIYKYFCGVKLGKFYDAFSNFFVYLSYIIMISGAAAAGNQQFGLPKWVGGVVMIVLTIGTVLMGLKNFVNIIGSIMPIVVVACFALAIITLVNYAPMISRNVADLPSLLASKKMLQASSSWWMAVLSYVGFSLLWLAAFLAETGRTASGQKEAKAGAVIGAVGFSASIIILTVALMSAVHIIAGSDIPSLVLANKISPIFGNFYTMILFIGIYSTAVPLLWNPCARFASEGSPKFKILVASLGVAGGIVGLFVEFPSLINIVYVINGYVGVLLLAIMVFHFFRYKGFLKPSSREKLESEA